jgi:hypothetical protein
MERANLIASSCKPLFSHFPKDASFEAVILMSGGIPANAVDEYNILTY